MHCCTRKNVQQGGKFPRKCNKDTEYGIHSCTAKKKVIFGGSGFLLVFGIWYLEKEGWRA